MARLYYISVCRWFVEMDTGEVKHLSGFTKPFNNTPKVVKAVKKVEELVSETPTETFME